jgi:apolipoprotein N-acyltransferase
MVPMNVLRRAPSQHSESRLFVLVPRLLVALGAIGSGALAACGFQPLSLWPLTFLGLAVLIELVVRCTSGRGAFMVGWCFGVGHFTLGNNWIATAFTYQAAMPAWLGAIAVVLLSLYLAIYPALATLAAWLALRGACGSRDDAASERPAKASACLAFAFALAAAWIVTEWLRGWVFTGFAWNPLGIVLLGPFESRGLAFLAPWMGTYGLSGVLVLLASLPALLVRLAAPRRGLARWAWGLPALALAAALALIMSSEDPWITREEGQIRYTVVQPDLRQEVINDPRQFESNFVKLASLSLPTRPGEKRIVFWPESGLGDYLRDGYPAYLYQLYTYAGDPVLARKRIGRVIGPYSLLLTGAVDLVIEDGDSIAARNSVTALDGNGRILAGYSKAHLVPYGEYLPLRWLLEPLGASRLVAGALDFLPGPGPRTLDFGAMGEAGIQICYEIVFSGQVVDPANRPDYIFNPSNDGWFGTWGPPQHLAQARLRAIEEGLPVIRATTTGISAVIDADGIVRQHLPWRTAGRMDGRIPPAHEQTLFARYGNTMPLGLAALLGLVAVSVVALKRRAS